MCGVVEVITALPSADWGPSLLAPVPQSPLLLTALTQAVP